MSHYDFWVHGTSVQVEQPELTKSIWRWGSGTVVSQDKGVNWFHFPIPAPTVIDDVSMNYHDAWLHYKELTNANLTDVHVRDVAYADPIFKTDLNWAGDPARKKPEDLAWFNLPDSVQVKQGVVLSVKVAFIKAPGSIKFLGVGMRFDK